MTREEAIEEIIDTFADEWADEMIKALEQEPILDKIRAEIEQTSETIDGFLMHDGTKKTVLQILDKYNTKSEDNNGRIS